MKNICKLLINRHIFIYKGNSCECAYFCHLQQSLYNDPEYFPMSYDSVIKLNDTSIAYKDREAENIKRENIKPCSHSFKKIT